MSLVARRFVIADAPCFGWGLVGACVSYSTIRASTAVRGSAAELRPRCASTQNQAPRSGGWRLCTPGQRDNGSAAKCTRWAKRAHTWPPPASQPQLNPPNAHSLSSCDEALRMDRPPRPGWLTDSPSNRASDAPDRRETQTCAPSPQAAAPALRRLRIRLPSDVQHKGGYNARDPTASATSCKDTRERRARPRHRIAATPKHQTGSASA